MNESLKKIVIFTFLLALPFISRGVVINWGSGGVFGFGDASGDDLAAGSFAEVGYYESGVFAPLDSATIGTGFGGAAGALTASSGNLNTSSSGLNIAESQLAIRWSEGSSFNPNNFGLAYYSIDGGDSIANQWKLKDGDGSSSDSESNAVEISNLADSDTGQLVANAVIVRGSFISGTTSSGFEGTFTTAIPEPSSYATIAGLLGLAYAVSRRRRRSSSLTRS